MKPKNKKTMLIGAAALAAIYFFTKGKKVSTPAESGVNPYDENNYTGPVDAIDPSGGGGMVVDAGDLGFFPSSINGANGVFL
jgi:hypothetical protein